MAFELEGRQSNETTLMVIFYRDNRYKNLGGQTKLTF